MTLVNIDKNIYTIWHKDVGTLTDTICALLVAVLFLFCYKSGFMMSLS